MSSWGLVSSGCQLKAKIKHFGRIKWRTIESPSCCASFRPKCRRGGRCPRRGPPERRRARRRRMASKIDQTRKSTKEEERNFRLMHNKRLPSHQRAFNYHPQPLLSDAISPPRQSFFITSLSAGGSIDIIGSIGVSFRKEEKSAGGGCSSRGNIFILGRHAIFFSFFGATDHFASL